MALDLLEEDDVEDELVEPADVLEPEDVLEPADAPAAGADSFGAASAVDVALGRESVR
ncbi:MAG: hypothetical protein ACYC1Z_06885 [Georgenia sp.]